MKHITMKDVASRAGVSQATVSHVINGTAPISENIIKKVNEAIDELGYLPNAMAKSLKTHKSNIIGVLAPNVSIRFYGELVKSIERLLRKSGYIVLLCNTFYKGHHEKEYIETLIAHNVIGVIFCADIVNEKSYSLLKKNNIPTVILDTQKNLDGAFSVQIDNELMARMGVSHLYDVGARVISYCSEPIATSMLQTRYDCFKHAVNEFGLGFDERKCFIAQNQYDHYSKIEMGYNLGANVLVNDNIDAVFASSDEFAFGIIKRLKEHNIEIPRQIQIMGCDNDPFSSFITPTLTTIWQPISNMTEIGISMLLNLIDGKTPNQWSECLEPNIIIRESTLKIAVQGS